MITRRTQFKPFVAIGTDIIYRGGLQPEELGVYAAMASKPDNWDFNEQVMARELHLSQTEIHRILKALERKGYVRERMGRFGVTWDFYETSYLIPQQKQQVIPGPKPKEEPQPKAEAKPEEQTQDDGEEPQLSGEEMAQRFFEHAKKLAAMRDLNRAIRG